MLVSLQYYQNQSESQLLQLLITSSQQVPTVRSLVCLLKCFNYLRLSLLVVQLLLETLITQSQGRSSSLYQPERWWRALKMIKGRIAYPFTLIPCITIVYFQLPSQTAFSLPRLSKAVTTAPQEIQPIIKPVLLKLYVLLSQMLYLALILATRLNQPCTTLESSQRARLQLDLQLNFTLSSS